MIENSHGTGKDLCENDERELVSHFDVKTYLPELADFDLAEGEKLALLQTLWDIMKAFVEMGRDVGRADICGRIFDSVDRDENNTSDDVKSSFARATETNGQDTRKERPA